MAAPSHMIGDGDPVIADPAMVRVYELVDRIAPLSLPVLIVAETGSGKELVARRLHARSTRCSRPMVTVNCAAIPDTLASRELFGHERGAFTDAREDRAGLLEAASGSTLFLDEFGELAPSTQSRLLRALETGRVTRLGATRETAIDVRFVAATNRDLDADIEAGKFRKDLFYRLATAVVDIPPLRERPIEIRLLAAHFLGRARQAAQRDPLRITAAAMARMQQHAWPGNVRELKNMMEFLGGVLDGPDLELEHVEEQLARTSRSPSSYRGPIVTTDVQGTASPHRFIPLAEEVAALEARRIHEALEATGYNKTQAAQLLGMPMRTFSERTKHIKGKRGPGGGRQRTPHDQ